MKPVIVFHAALLLPATMAAVAEASPILETNCRYAGASCTVGAGECCGHCIGASPVDPTDGNCVEGEEKSACTFRS